MALALMHDRIDAEQAHDPEQIRDPNQEDKEGNDGADKDEAHDFTSVITRLA